MNVLCIGDSLANGSMGHSYLKYLPFKVINKGINGDTLYCAYKRLVKYINNPRYKNIDTYIIEIGTNDLLIPYLSTLSKLWSIRYRKRIIKKNCISNDKQFEDQYRKCLELLKKHHKNIIAIGMPYLELSDFPNNKIKRRNEIIKELCKEYNVKYINIYENDLELNPISINNKLFNLLISNIIMYILPITKDIYSKKRHLNLTVDGAHFNSSNASLLSSALEKELLYIKNN